MMRSHDDEMIVCDYMRFVCYTSSYNHLQENIDFPCFLRKRHQRTDGPTDRRTDGQTDPHIEMG